jgi:CubicO group peptidase (beta-lactamase class C family)
MAGIVIARHGKVAHFSAIGFADIEHRLPMARDTIFRTYSMTKQITSVALMMLFKEGRFQLTGRVSKYLPQFASVKVLRDPNGPLENLVAPTRAPTVQDLLRHTAGFTHGLGTDVFDDLYTRANVLGENVPLSDMIDRLAKLPLRYQPGTEFVYSVGPDVAARLVEVSGFGLGFAVLRDPAEAGYISYPGTYFWPGAANTQFWVDAIRGPRRTLSS